MTHVGSGNNVKQTGFRGRYDDGGETDATWIADFNVDFGVPLDTNFRLRLLTFREVPDQGWAVQHRMKYDMNGGEATGFLNVASPRCHLSQSEHFDDGDDTTQQLGSGAWADDTNNSGMTDGEVTYYTNPAMLYPIGTYEWEFEFCMQFASDDGFGVIVGDEFEFLGQMHLQGDYTGVPSAYILTPIVTIIEAPPEVTPMKTPDRYQQRVGSRIYTR